MSGLKLQGALLLLRGAESLQTRLRSYSSTRAKEEARKRWVCEQTELLEVLEARVKQLRADNVSEVAIDRVHMCGSGRRRLLQLAPPRTVAAPGLARNEPLPKRDERGASQPSRWMEKLNKEKTIKHKRLLRLEAKLSAAETKPASDATSGSRPLLRAPKQTPSRLGAADESVSKSPAGKDRPKAAKGRATKKQAPGATPGCRDDREGSAAPEDVQEHILSQDAAVAMSPAEGEGRSYQRNVQLNILAYLDTCIFLNQLERAQKCLMFYHRAHMRRKLLDISMYNLVMHGYARKGVLHQVGQLFNLLDEARLKPDQNSYVAVLSCMGRSGTHSHIIARCLQQLTEHGLRLEDLFRDAAFEGDEAEMALRAIRSVRPDFCPPPPLHQHDTCTVPLLQNFYAKWKPVSYPKLDFTAQDLRDQFREQLALEALETVTIQSVEKDKPLTERVVRARELLAGLRSHWHESLLRSLRESKLHMGQRISGQLSLYPFLCVLEDEEYVDILLRSVSLIPPHGESLMVLARELGTKVYNRYVIQKKSRSHLVEKIQRIYEDYVQLLAKDGQPDNFLPREYWEKLTLEAGCRSSLVSKEHAWPHSLLVQLGLHLVELMVQVLKMESNLLTPGMEQKLIPVLYHVYSFRSGRQIGFIRPHPILTRLLLEAAESSLTFDAFAIPTLCPPLPWVSPHFGAYLLSPTKLMRFVDGALQHQALLERCPRGDLFSVLDALNQLSGCPWKVNGAVLDVVVAIFNDKGDEKLGVPPPLSEAPQPARRSPGGGPLSKLALKQEMARCRKKAAEMYSLRMDTLYKLSIAQHVRERVFWFPHNMDFRGRTYPCPPHFNHLGNDLMRAILLFAEGKPLGPRGLDWLKIHLINLTGLKKKNSLRDRLGYADQILADILDSADRPLTGKKWWMSTDEPWQALACCMEIAKAVRSPDPAAYVSHFPVHQDGSCNGLQHYAALGRDVVGAASVNLTPCDVPQDVYSRVAQQVEVFRKRDADEGVKVAQVLEGFIGRKVVKQTVMTVVYGVTRFGGRLQIEKRLKEIDDFPPEYVWEASSYLVRQVFNSLKEMFSGTREIQDWLTQSARLIAQSGRTVEWVTPLGLPIIQPYHRSKSTVVNSSMQTVNLKSQHDISQKPNTVKQKNAFPPNFIHSLDSTHMMLTALHCHRRGLTFVSVHDCYWTHALTVDIMNQVCREQFVDLHSQPILEDLSRFMLQKYCKNVPVQWKNKKSSEFQKLVNHLSKVPEKGDFDLEKVKESTYFFS
ncbi:DNA-directed RNA polymerase, mitochondrial [Elgaria multicarinata webbii]|uniref:DNA-directed RNA polymerase, mitochondrial n=1 Tax=Elgaria multicarinata webbii TaxID=159646 RepID=UPI002FCD0976